MASTTDFFPKVSNASDFTQPQLLSTPRLFSISIALPSTFSLHGFPNCSSRYLHVASSDINNLFRSSMDLNNGVQLGGAYKAMPKGVLNVMGVQGFTIYNVKSHFQKYQLAKYIPESLEGGKSDKKKGTEVVPNLDATSRIRITEALQMQMEVQKRLHEQREDKERVILHMEATRETTSFKVSV
eukprot:Gb_19757 [translate_table: standard]